MTGEKAPYQLIRFEPGKKYNIPLEFNLKKLASERQSILLPGHRLCAGCGAPIVIKLLSFALRGPTIIVNATGCVEVASTIFPYTSWAVPWLHVAFENSAAAASGVEAAIKAFKRTNRLPYDYVDVIVLAGDGGTFDIGFQALSGMAERGHNIMYVLYDNEAYMNTGIQRSSGTPPFAWTTTSPVGKVLPGKTQAKKPIADIMVAHRIPYVATVSPAFWGDAMRKFRKGIETEGPTFIHALSSCNRGWRHDTALAITVSKLAVDTCFFPLWEFIKGKGYYLTDRSLQIAKNPKLKLPVEKYLEPQRRFAHLLKPENRHLLRQLQEYVDTVWEDLLNRAVNAPK